MTLRDRFLALVVATLWGCNVVAIKIGLHTFPPFFFAALRFGVLAVPALVLVRPPAVPARWVVGYGLGFGVVQFGALFVAMHLGMPAGLASLVLQSSAPFTALLGVLFLRERVTGRQLAGLALALLGLSVVALGRHAGALGLVPVLLTVLAGLGWAIGSVCSRLAHTDEPLQLVFWMSVVAAVPLYAMSLVVEGARAGSTSLVTAVTGRAWPAVCALLYIVVLTTLVGSGLWSALLRRNPAGVVAQYSLAVPVVGMLASWLALGEVPSLLDLVAGAVVVLGLLLGSGSRPDRSGS